MAYVDRYHFKFKCELLPIVNDKIRIHYWVPVHDKDYKAEFFNSLGRKTPASAQNLTNIFFKRSSEFRAEISCEFDSDLTGLRSWYALFHTKDAFNLTKFNNWNFTKSLYWDSVDEGFWFDSNTTILVYSLTYTIGQQQLENSMLRLQPEKINLKEQNVTASFAGIPTSAQDIVSSKVLWRKTQNIDDDHFTGVRTKFNRSLIQSNIDFDFTERVYDVHFYDFIDLLSKLGGLRASLLPILGYLMPLLSLHFLWRLSAIVDNKMH